MPEVSANYTGFEQGPIRPPSEAGSLLIRVTRNCPWNRCGFCDVYKDEKFSLRPVEDVLEDIARVRRYVEALRETAKENRGLSPDAARRYLGGDAPDRAALGAARHWLAAGAESVFIQDANSLIIKPERLVTILCALRESFPWIKRITSYARSHTVARIALNDLQAMHEAGLSRLHIGMESGSDRLLALVQKGVSQEEHVRAGRLVKEAGIELSEYIMPGLGGRELSREHAVESAAALSAINPDFIRLRTFAMPADPELFLRHWPQGFTLLNDEEIAEEMDLFLSALTGITSHLKSDHILNLFEDMDGIFPQDKECLAAMPKNFLALPEEDRLLYRVGRRLGLFAGLGDLGDTAKARRVRDYCREMDINAANIDYFIGEIMRRFI
ncbi:MAG: radical SAM protein [Desulfobulbaceae bacterium]|jgi:hypothetical protein|nr:radical SAM protein [Desulfobulbaceae bacterium]